VLNWLIIQINTAICQHNIIVSKNKATGQKLSI